MIDTSVMIEDYKQGMSLNGITRKYGISQYKFKKILQRYGVHIRSRFEQNKFSPQNQRLYQINDNYFSKQSANMAYLLGFIAADGCVYSKNNTIKIGLSSVDKDFLEQIKNELKATYPIGEYETKDGFLVSEFKFTSFQIKQDLANYGIVPNKTYNFSFPKNLKEEFYLDFIRGYFDGDGSVGKSGQGLRWQLCSYTKPILETIIDILDKKGIPKVNIYKNRNLFYFQYSTNSTKVLYNLLYYKNCFCLPRKKDKYEQILSMK